jgi:nucleoside-diphosphate-sugar epimerase
MRVLVTGGTGFIGHHVCRRFVDRGDHVVALVRSPGKAARLPAGVEPLKGDLSLFADPGLELPPFDVVVHLAGVVAADHLAQYEAINFTAVRDLVECVARQKWKPARLLFASSLAAAGPSARDAPELAPVPKALLYVAMLVSTLGAALFRYKNQLDAKQYAQMVAPAFLCSSERLRADLGWSPRHGLADCLANAAKGYRAAGALRAGLRPSGYSATH